MTKTEWEPDYAIAQAEKRILPAKASGDTVLALNIKGLKLLPDLKDLPKIEKVLLDFTAIENLAVLSALPNLSRLTMEFSRLPDYSD